MEYKFQTLELNILKGLVGEHLARSFIRNVLASRLIKEENWDHVVFDKDNHRRHWSRRLFDFQDFREDFVSQGYYVASKLLSKYARVVGLLRHNHCTPDGLLFKLREIGCKQVSKQSVLMPNPSSDMRYTQRPKDSDVMPIVEGDIEVIEIKCGRSAKLMRKQREIYSILISRGIPLRVVKVRIVSFDSNKFLVEERRLDKPLGRLRRQ